MNSCVLCGEETRPAFRATVLAKHDAAYMYCSNCGLLQALEPHWLAEAYSNPVAMADTGILRRNLRLSRASSCLFYYLLGRKGRFLDVAGGYGLFVRHMRDVGFDFYWSDLYCKNVFARGFESCSSNRYDVITAFEVLEHVPDPLEFLKREMHAAGCEHILLSTELFEGLPPAPGSWWYYAFGTGQHISFYQRRTLEFIAARLGKRLLSNGSLHLLTSKKIPPSLFSILTSSIATRILFCVPALFMKSKTMDDHAKLLPNPLKQQA